RRHPLQPQPARGLLTGRVQQAPAMAHAGPRAMAEWNGSSTISPIAAIPAKAGMAALLACLLSIASAASPVHAAATTTAASVAPRVAALARTGCDAIAARVDALPGNAPLLLRSYDSRRGQGAPDLPPLHSAAFTYDNALAVIALLACHKRPQAERIGEALRRAAMHDTRLRDAYRAGAVEGDKPLPNGWRDAQRKQWVDAAHEYSGAYQDGTSCGNVAWTALALLALHGAAGFHGGVESYLLVPRKASWKSTEHNIDLAAMFEWLARISAPGGDWDAQA